MAGANGDRLRVAVAGPGGWGKQHSRVFSGRADTELCAVVGRDPGRTASYAARTGATAQRWTPHPRRLLPRRRPANRPRGPRPLGLTHLGY
jgi:predicted dehydrogenase